MFLTLITSTVVIAQMVVSLISLPAYANEPKARIMRITGYTATGHKSAIGQKVIPGKTAAVSRNCAYLLNEDVYVEGHGVWHVNDLTAKWVGDKFKICTLDLAVPSEAHARKVGNTRRNVVRLTNANSRTTKRSR